MAYRFKQAFDSTFSFGLEKNNTQVINSPYIGKRIEILPNVLLVKMENWGGWLDEFLYVYDKVPVNLDKASIIYSKKIAAVTKFKVIDVRIKVDKVMGERDICILQNENREDEKIFVECVVFKENPNHLEEQLITGPEYKFVRVIK